MKIVSLFTSIHPREENEKRQPLFFCICFYSVVYSKIPFYYCLYMFFFFFRMPTKFLKGEDNSRLKVLEVNGFCIPTWPYPTHEQEYLTLSNWKAMDNDILISAYPKSG